jgi:hypothetical protein
MVARSWMQSLLQGAPGRIARTRLHRRTDFYIGVPLGGRQCRSAARLGGGASSTAGRRDRGDLYAVRLGREATTTIRSSLRLLLTRLEMFFYAASPRMTGTSAEEEIDEPTGKFLGPCRDVAYPGQLNIHRYRSSIGQL